jgi:alginate O-acetyltransferase complex protein AlgI
LIFNSLDFAVFFFIVIALCAIWPGARTLILLASSFVFYSWISWLFGAVLLAMSVCGYLAAARFETLRTGRGRVVLLCVAILVVLSPLLVLKYWNFAADTVHWAAAMAGLTVALVQINQPLPPGISFHSFQLICYLVDVFRRQASVERAPGRFFLFSSFFPQLVAGPIERPNHLMPQLADAGLLKRENSAVGFELFLYGLFLKLAIADVVGIKVDEIYSASQSQPGAVLLAATMLFYVQIYCDFAGYSLMALGISRVIGVELVLNFRSPVLAVSPADFWRRWHVSLSQWFRDYVYIPLGGDRRGVPRWVLAVAVTFLLSGLWHGASWTFVLWGAVHGAGLIVAALAASAWPRAAAIPGTLFAAWLLTQLFVVLSWVFFRAASVTQANQIMGTIASDFLVTGRGWTDIAALPQLLGVPVGAFLLGVLVLTWVTRLDLRLIADHTRSPLRARGRLLGYVQQGAMLAAIGLAATFAPAASRPFIYFQF